MRSSIAAVLFCAVMVSCDSGDDTSVNRPELEAERARLVERSLTASDLEREILADGFVTDEEAELAVRAFVDCADDEGLVIEPNEESGNYSFGYAVDGGGDGQRESDIYDRCERATYGLVGQMLGIQAALPGDVLEERNELVERCLIEAGFDAEGWPSTSAELDPSIEADCVDNADAAIES